MNTNFLAVVVAAVINMVVGFLWYGPLFGKPWSALMGFTPEKMAEAKQKGMGKSYAAMVVGSLIMAYALARLVIVLSIATAFGALHLAFGIWLGFIAVVLLGSILWEGKPVKLYLINSLYYLVTLCLMALVFAYWR